jgi:pilus assembly protein CpaB
MRAKTILTLLFLVSLGVAGAIAYRAMSLPARGSRGAAMIKGPDALVAAVALQPGTLLRAEDIEWRQLSGPAQPGAILRPTAAQIKQNPLAEEQALKGAYGAAVRIAVKAGQPIRREVIVRPGDRDFLRVVLTPGQRAIAIPVRTGGASAGLLEPGDHVDVILTQRFDGHAEGMAHRSVAETVVEDLRVLAVGWETGAGGAAVPHNDFGHTVTLEVTPAQAQKINVATELGKLSLTLRPAEAKAAPELKPVAATWAGDVSPALGSVRPPANVVVDPPVVAVLRGSKAPEKVKVQ